MQYRRALSCAPGDAASAAAVAVLVAATHPILPALLTRRALSAARQTLQGPLDGRQRRPPDGQQRSTYGSHNARLPHLQRLCWRPGRQSGRCLNRLGPQQRILGAGLDTGSTARAPRLVYPCAPFVDGNSAGLTNNNAPTTAGAPIDIYTKHGDAPRLIGPLGKALAGQYTCQCACGDRTRSPHATPQGESQPVKLTRPVPLPHARARPVPLPRRRARCAAPQGAL